MSYNKCNVLVVDMQPIDPPVGGGRIRLLGLYHDLGERLSATYIGTYDWPGEKFRDHFVSNTLREIDIPLSPEHFAECRKWQERAGGKNVIDVTFHLLAHLSPQFLEHAQKEAACADIVIFSHPWLFPLLKSDLKKSTLVVYDSQNVEGFLRYNLLRENDFGISIAEEVVRIEHELCHAAELVLVCSQEDKEMYHNLYSVPFHKMRLAPNGVFTGKVKAASDEERGRAQRRLGLSGKNVAVFMGSNYGPNREAATFIVEVLAPELPDMVFVLVGGVGEGFRDAPVPPNVIATGIVSDEERLLYLAAADMAVNPMFGGSGTNVKMFDFMAAGLPIVTTAIGARGIEGGSEKAMIISDARSFVEAIRSTMHDKTACIALGRAARQLVEEKYSWEKISRRLGSLINRYQSRRSTARPFFSVIVPSYERHENLRMLMTALSRQLCRDFEVIIVDQSRSRWNGAGDDFGCDIFYVHTDVKGAVKARNTAALYARGDVLAFTDDDCMPEPTWLSSAKALFEQSTVIGVEGLIISDKLHDPAYRPVTNDGLPGIGFMTANLFMKSEIFSRINGFDEGFDHPHFREDTDLAWRALQYGDIPFSRDAVVFHPPHLRNSDRESLVERNKFFEKDVLLLKKHPQKYLRLFLMERHFELTRGFWENFTRGAVKYGVDTAKYEVIRYFQDLHELCKRYEYEPSSQTLPAIVSEIGEDQMTRNDRLNEQLPWIASAVGNRTVSSDLSSVLAEHLQHARFDLPTKTPPEIQAHLGEASEITKEVKKIIGDKTHGGYFDSSTERYNHYFSIAKALLKPGALVLDIGNAPGHVGIGLHLLGIQVQGLNLNDCWKDTYPSPEWLKTFNVISHDIEKKPLPYKDNTFDAVYFTEVLEHIAIKNPAEILPDFLRVLKPGGLFILSTPNVCNISNIYALMNGKNIFWPNDMFYGSVDRHNREYTPDEVYEVVAKAGFSRITMYGFNCYSNWKSYGAEFANTVVSRLGNDQPLLNNTTMLFAFK